MTAPDQSWKKRVAWGSLTLALVCLSAFLRGGRTHFFQTLPQTLIAFGELGAIVWSVMLAQWGFTKLAIKKGWSSEAELEKSADLRERARKKSWPLVVVLVLWGMGGLALLLWWFTNPVPGRPGISDIDYAKINRAYPLMVVTELAVVLIIWRIGQGWVHSKAGVVTHRIVCLLFLVFFFAYFIFCHEPNVVLAIWAMSITIFPSLYALLLFQSHAKFRLSEEDRLGRSQKS